MLFLHHGASMSQNHTLIRIKFFPDNYFYSAQRTYDLTRRNGGYPSGVRVYDRGNGATILLYSSAKNRGSGSPVSH